MKNPSFQAPTSRGFTLTELSVVLVITSILIGGLLVPLSSQIDARNSNDTKAAMAEIREALLGFAAVNGYFPCPAIPTIASGSPDAGLEGGRNSGSCIHPAGVLPWASLAVAERDAWGRRYSYRVTPEFSNAPPLLPFNLSSSGDIKVLSAAGGVAIATFVPIIVISHGKNGNGAYTTEGAQLPEGSDADELENRVLITPAGVWSDGSVAKEFVKRAAPAVTYDDEVVWIAPGVLFNRMITAGKLP
ncbi:MAG: type II secretion system GspH family protein [Candidatus Accumulibacter sp.]|uniref:type II secretion system protein n=1 Tax=Accumulibacter sp. TaxID=2053492 RepID=UPI002582BB6E|nr:type II secretion system protein [Accumulibacter sp.]MCM8620180.1 type II secretion system GspH family protein [Accumulibacter sp.]